MEFSEFVTQKLLQETGQSEHLTDREKHRVGRYSHTGVHRLHWRQTKASLGSWPLL